MTSITRNINHTHYPANRLTSVNGQAVQWDDNGREAPLRRRSLPPKRGNMLADGQAVYKYNAANKLVGVTKGTSSIVYAYSGLGDRLKQIADGVTTDYTLDINAGLTQVLDDGTNKYLYGNQRISQIAETQTGYFLPDALGSMRQMTDSSADLTLAKSYDPYGNVVNSSGTGETVYGYTGEMQSGGLVHLRARDYASQLGRFASRDTWEGGTVNPLSFNNWIYVEGNPIRFNDPTGHVKEEDQKEAEKIITELNNTYNIHIVKDWGYVPLVTGPSIPYKDKCMWNEGNWRTIEELRTVKNAIQLIAPQKMSIEKFRSVFGYLRFSRWDINNNVRAFAPPGILNVLGDVVLPNYLFNSDELYATSGVIHELGHVWDYKSNNALSIGLMKSLGTYLCDDYGNNCTWHQYKAKINDSTGERELPEQRPDISKSCKKIIPDPQDENPSCRNFPYSATKGDLPTTILTNPGAEDWAQSFSAYIYPNFFDGANLVGVRQGSIRFKYIQGVINE